MQITLVLISTFLSQGDALLASLRHRSRDRRLQSKLSVLNTEIGLAKVETDEAREVKKLAFLEVLRKKNDEPKDPQVDAAIIELSPFSPAKSYSNAELERALQGEWTSISCPDFPDGQGKNLEGDYQFTLGRMSFGTFSPKSLLCSIQSITNTVDKLKTPSVSGINRLEDDPELYSYDVSVLFTIEEDGPCKGVMGSLSTKGYSQRDPETSDRVSVWFSGGEIRHRLSEDSEKWKEVFGSTLKPLRKSWKDRIQAFLARRFIGLELINSSKYEFKRLVGGRGKAYLEILYLDDDLRVTRGNRGSVVISRRAQR